MNPPVYPEVPPEEVVARLELLLPGLGASVGGRSLRRPRLVEPGDRGERVAARAILGDIDGILEHAESCGVIEKRTRLPENFAGVDVLMLAALVLSGIPVSREDVLVVSDRMSCRRVSAAHLQAFLLRDVDVTGECSFDGDEIFVATVSLCAVVVHHSGWIFSLRVHPPTLDRAA